MARPPGILPCGCAGGFRGFPTAPPCAGGKLARIHASHPADFPPPARRAIGAPGKAARSCAQKQRQPQEHPTPPLLCTHGREATGSRRLAFALASGAHDARPVFRGPLGGGEAGTTRPRSGHRQGWRCLFAGTGVPSKNPGTRPRTRSPWMGAGRAIGVASLLATFLWPRREK